MVLVSHRRKFIYLKTIKTAGTSVEALLEPSCLDPVRPPFTERTQTRYSMFGVVGFRGAIAPGGKPPSPWYNHMPASEVRALVGQEIWSNYLKICAIRNPFDKIVSLYFFSLAGRDSQHRKQQLIESGFEVCRNDFRQFVLTNPLPLDRSLYVLDGEICIDSFIRYERLAEDVAYLCQTLGIDKVEPLPRLKSGLRFFNSHYSAFYCEATRKRVEETYAFEIDRFGYRFEHG